MQKNIDSSYDELEQKKAELSQARKDVQALVDQLAEAKGQMAELSEERTSLSQQLEIVKEGLKVRSEKGGLHSQQEIIKVTGDCESLFYTVSGAKAISQQGDCVRNHTLRICWHLPIFMEIW